MPESASPLDVGLIVTGLLGGLALFLYGMRKMTDALKAVAGDGLRNLLSKLTRNRFSAALAGTIITGIVQSSSVTTVLLVGFISAGLLNFSQSIGVIIGANIGTTITAQIIAFKVYKYGLVMVAAGFFIEVLSRNERLKHWGVALMGLGLIFFGMEMMSSSTSPLRQWQPFIQTMQSLSNPLAGVLMGLAFTAIVQSSSATTGIVIVLASQGMISLESGIALLFGANVGTCVTASISAIGRPRDAVLAAWVHVIFNLGGVLLWVFFIPQFADLVRQFSPVSSQLSAAEQIAKDTPRQIANAHTLFNIANALLFIGFTKTLAKLVEKIVPQKEKALTKHKPVTLYLDDIYLDQPSLALDIVRRELVRMAQGARGTLSRAFRVVTEGGDRQVAKLGTEDKYMDAIHGEIVRFLGKLSQKNISKKESDTLADYISVANDLESIADVVQDNLLHSARKRLRLHVKISPITLKTLKPIYKKTVDTYEQMLEALESGNKEHANAAAKSKNGLLQLTDEATSHLINRLVANEPNRVEAFQIESDIIEHLKRINTLTRRIARCFVK
ncbi:phosphate:Na+ symporter [Alteromonadaceae bacterium Bs31]|nr:phosphate:Na+ symporter [Alteromonadaceae bacterium Bs31]